MQPELYKQILSQGPVSMFMWENVTNEWPVVEVTDSVEGLTGWPKSAFLNKDINYAGLIHLGREVIG